jgi:uncharacterized phiE125 gp8 family phage protein
MNILLKEPTIVTDLAPEPVTLPEAKAWIKLSVDYTADDAMLTDLIKAARGIVERIAGLSFGAKEIQATVQMDATAGPYALPWGPVTAITKVSMGTTDLATDQYSLSGGLYTTTISGAQEITYSAGMAVLPAELKNDILRVTAWLYQNRGVRFEPNTEPLPFPEWNSLAANRYNMTVI